MSERERLLDSIAGRVADYRAGEVSKPSPEHIDRWVGQFDAGVQEPMLSGLDHVLSKTYFSRASVLDFLDSLATTKELVGEEPARFWHGVNFLSIQQNGTSQQEVLQLFEQSLQRRCGLKGLKDCRSKGGPFLYLDDVLFSGGRVGNDLSEWLKSEAPPSSTVHVVLIGLHTFGHWKVRTRLEKEAAALGKTIHLKWWRAVCFENRLSSRNVSEVLWPAALPDNAELRAYIAEEKKFPFQPRMPGGKLEHEVFASEDSRQLLERELLLAGVKIRSWCQNPSRALRPLGFSPFGLGFGSVIVTFRNCPNNCPLALWWGDPDAAGSSPLSKWYPLFPRKTYAMGPDVSFL